MSISRTTKLLIGLFAVTVVISVVLRASSAYYFLFEIGILGLYYIFARAISHDGKKPTPRDFYGFLFLFSLVTIIIIYALISGNFIVPSRSGVPIISKADEPIFFYLNLFNVILLDLFLFYNSLKIRAQLYITKK